MWHQGTRAILDNEGSSPGKEGREEGTGRTVDSCAWDRNQPQIAGKAPTGRWGESEGVGQLGCRKGETGSLGFSHFLKEERVQLTAGGESAYKIL